MVTVINGEKRTAQVTGATASLKSEIAAWR